MAERNIKMEKGYIDYILEEETGTLLIYHHHDGKSNLISEIDGCEELDDLLASTLVDDMIAYSYFPRSANLEEVFEYIS